MRQRRSHPPASARATFPSPAAPRPAAAPALSQPPATAGRDAWRAYWRAAGQPWRTEPEIAPERQAELAARRDVPPDVKQGVYPFGCPDLGLTRADIEWLLATHEAGRGPVDWDDPAQRRRDGLDLRGAVLSGLDLRGLPLARLRGGLTEDEWRNASAKQIEAAALHLERAELGGAHLEGALLEGAHLERARLRGASLREARLNFARLETAYLADAHLEGATLLGAWLDGALLTSARLDGANLSNAHLAGVELLGAHLEGAQLTEAALGGKVVPGDDLERIRRSQPDFPPALPGAHLGGAFFDSATALDDADLGDDLAGCVSVADARWGGVNLAVLDWTPIRRLGDELEAARPANAAGKPKDDATRLAELRCAVRANRQIAVALRDQGLNEEADRFAYRAQKLQRAVLLHQALRGDGRPLRRVLPRARKLGAWLFSGFLDVLAGYGYKPGRSLAAYLLVIGAFAAAYARLGATGPHPALTPLGALIFSLTSFHGRGFFPGGLALDSPLTVLAAAEAIIGLVIEISFIATFTQRFFAR